MPAGLGLWGAAVAHLHHAEDGARASADHPGYPSAASPEHSSRVRLVIETGSVSACAGSLCPTATTGSQGRSGGFGFHGPGLSLVVGSGGVGWSTGRAWRPVSACRSSAAQGVAGQVEYGAPAGAASGPAMEKIRGPGRSRRRRYAPQSPDTKQARRQNEGSRSAAARGKAAPPATWQRFAQDLRGTPVRQKGTVLRTRWLAAPVPTSQDQHERLRILWRPGQCGPKCQALPALGALAAFTRPG